jgi:hypothetical protein
MKQAQCGMPDSVAACTRLTSATSRKKLMPGRAAGTRLDRAEQLELSARA